MKNRPYPTTVQYNALRSMGLMALAFWAVLLIVYIVQSDTRILIIPMFAAIMASGAYFAIRSHFDMSRIRDEMIVEMVSETFPDDERQRLIFALHDAINRPKGVVPVSAEEWYDPVFADRIEKHRG